MSEQSSLTSADKATGVPTGAKAFGIGAAVIMALAVLFPSRDPEPPTSASDIPFETLRQMTEESIRATMSDPGSAQFRNVRPGGSQTVVCGEVNGRNAFGGYAPFRRFYASSTKPVIGELLEIEPVTRAERAAQPDFDGNYSANCGPR